MPNPNPDEFPQNPKPPSKSNHDTDNSNSSDEDSVLDVSGKSLELSLFDNNKTERKSVKELYVYKNEFSLIPKALGELSKLRTLKFFANEVSLLSKDVPELIGLECLQVKVSSSIGLSGIPLLKFKGLKELDVSKVPRRPSVIPFLAEVVSLQCLTKLSVCHFNIRYLPPEIACLNKLEYLDLSFNRMKSLPDEIRYLTDLISFKVANNKLEEVPSGLMSLQRLKNLDLSNNRLKSLGVLELNQMHNLENLNLQYNMLLSVEIPSWICCNLEGNGCYALGDDSASSSVEMDEYETIIQEDAETLPLNGSNRTSANISSMTVSNSRYFASRRSGKRWKRQYYLQQKARLERLNSSRKLKGEDHGGDQNMKLVGISESGNRDIVGLGIACYDDDEGDGRQLDSGELGNENTFSVAKDGEYGSKNKSVGECTNVALDLVTTSEGNKSKCSADDDCLTYLENEVCGQEEVAFSILHQSTKSKRHSDGHLDNPKPCKFRKPADDSLSVSHKYYSLSFCGVDDRMVDGFYDAGRDRPFMPLKSYEQSYHIDSREVILLDRDKDEELDAITLSAQDLVFRLKQYSGFVKSEDGASVDNLQIASLLALFVSDHFGGSDKSSTVERARKSVSGSNYQRPFVCTCSTGNRDSICTSSEQKLENSEDIIFSDVCERSLSSIKTRQNSIIVPLGILKFGVCRHRATLMKYLCDRLEPPVPCELVRGYLDYQPHAWNIILIKKCESWVRMVVDACRPLDIREETDPEFFCRYIPLSRTRVSQSSDRICSPASFPSLSACDEFEKATSTSLVRCKFGSVEAAAKVRTLEVCGNTMEEIKEFEYSCLGEVRILGSLKHPSIVEMYGHQIFSKWLPCDGKLERRVLKSAIFMEYIKGGSLQIYLEKLSKAGKKHVPAGLAMSIARSVALALAEIHSKRIIHRDIKSENILIDLDRRVDGAPVVKLCDFDRAVPLRSYLHSCCIGHLGVPHPDVCVGTPRWMAPEVVQAMHKPNRYGLEVDIWSFGCLLMELLTLRVPYSGLSESEIYDMIQMGRRPSLTDEIEALRTLKEAANSQLGSELELTESELETLAFLVDLFYQCTEEDPVDRPTAEGLCKILLSHATSLADSAS